MAKDTNPPLSSRSAFYIALYAANLAAILFGLMSTTSFVAGTIAGTVQISLGGFLAAMGSLVLLPGSLLTVLTLTVLACVGTTILGLTFTGNAKDRAAKEHQLNRSALYVGGVALVMTAFSLPSSLPVLLLLPLGVASAGMIISGVLFGTDAVRKIRNMSARSTAAAQSVAKAQRVATGEAAKVAHDLIRNSQEVAQEETAYLKGDASKSPEKNSFFSKFFSRLNPTKPKGPKG